KKNYTDTKSDLFAIFLEKGFEFAKSNGFNTMVTMQSWLFLSSFEKIREKILLSKKIENLVHIGYNSFPEMNSKVVQAIAFVLRNYYCQDYKSSYIDLNNAFPQSYNKEKAFLEVLLNSATIIKNTSGFKQI